MKKMDDISAIVLSFGEKTTQEAIEKLRAQTCPIKEIILIEKVSPWAKAFSMGVSKVHTKFLLNCNADMLLYPHCVERLLAYMKSDVGLVIGWLVDPLCGRITGIKLYRTEALRAVSPKENTPTPDVDLVTDMKKLGWRAVFTNKLNIESRFTSEILGMHSPEYSPIYTYRKFKNLGIRIAKNKSLKELCDYYDRLRKSTHPLATMSIIALSLGLFCTSNKNMLDDPDVKEEFSFVEDFINGPAAKKESDKTIFRHRFLPLLKGGKSLFKQSFRVGKELRSAYASGAFRDLLNKAIRSKIASFRFIMIGLCYGFFHDPGLNIDLDKEWLKIESIKGLRNP